MRIDGSPASLAGLTRYIQKALDPNPYQNQSGRALPSLNLLA